MSDKPTTTTTEKKRRQSTPTQFVLVAAQIDESGKVQGTTFTQLPLPDGIDLTNPKHRSRAAIEAAVKRNLEEGKNTENYNGRKLHVIDLGPVFSLRVIEKKTTSVETA